MFFFFKQKTAYEMRISDGSSDVCSSDLYLPSFSAPLQVTNEKILPSGSTRPDHPRMSIWKLPLDDSANMAAYSVGRRLSLKPACPAMACTISAVDASMVLLAKVKDRKSTRLNSSH